VTVNSHLFEQTKTLQAGGVVLRASDDDQTHREKLARIVLDRMYEFVGLLDASGRILEINRAALEGAGLKLADIQGKHFSEARWWAVSQETKDQQKELIRRAGNGEFVRCDVEIYGQGEGEETIIVDYSLLPIRDKNGKITFLLPEGRNITGKKRAEDEIARKNEELQRLLDRIRELDSAKSNFFANISHELRTPLTLILGPAESLLREAGNLTGAQRRGIEVIHRNASMLLKHVNALLDLAKVDAGKMALNYTRFDLAVLVRTIAAHFDALAPQRSIAYSVAAPDRFEAEADVEKLEHILLNLLSNAFKFTPDGGRIRCALEEGGDGRLLLTVQDSGPGIAPELRCKIFERFQASPGTSHEPGGTGLGLAIARDFTELHGGTITVSSAPGSGALFQVELPLRAPEGTFFNNSGASRSAAGNAAHYNREAALPEQSASQEAGCAERPIVLIAEDNPDMRRFIAAVLQDDYRVVSAADGEAALVKATAEPPDLVVTDLMMPILGGDAFVAALRTHEKLAQVPVLVLSARADDQLRLKLLAESVQDYLTKPFSAPELRARARNLITMKRARDALQEELATQNSDLVYLASQLVASRRELQRSHSALQESEQRWRAVYEKSAAGIALTDLEGRILAANPAFRDMLGYAEDELAGLSLLQITPDADRDTVQSRLTQLVEEGTGDYHVERRYLHKDGSIRWANASVSLIPGNGTMPPMLLRIAEDITARKNAQEALAATQLELARVTRATALGELAASIAHEVNQPLAAVVANSHAARHWLAAKPENKSEVRDALERIVREANRASAVIARIRGFLSRGAPHKSAIGVGEVVAEVFAMQRDMAQARQVSLSFKSAPDLRPAIADRTQLQQVLLNLVANAIESMSLASRFGGTVEAEAWNGEAGMVHIAVRDTGVGLDPQQLDRVFDAFYTTKSEGMGMGLAISRSIVEAHGGRLWANANDGPGATFNFTLPARQRKAP
jgi:PAS domain S-box-containing protein